MAKDNEPRKATDKFKADDLEAIAATGDWRTKKEQVDARHFEQYKAAAQARGSLFCDLESKARRAARKVGLVAYLCRTQHLGNLGHFQVMDPKRSNMVVAGQHYDMTAQDVINFCRHFKV